MIKYLVAMLLICNTAYAGISVCRNSETNEVSNYSLRGDPIEGCSYFAVPGVNQTDYDKLRTLLKTIDKRYLKMTGTTILSVMEMAPAEKVAVDDAWAVSIQNDLLVTSRNGAKDSVDQLSPEGVRLRAAMLVTLDEVNNLRTWLRDFKAATAAATTLANLQTRVAALPNTPDRTATQLRTAIKAMIDNGAADA